MTPLKITDARAKELAALDEAATKAPWLAFDAQTVEVDIGDERLIVADLAERELGGRTTDVQAIVAARNAFGSLLADRATLLDALRRAVEANERALGRQVSRCPGHRAYDCSCALARRDADRANADLRALLASAEGGSDG